MILRILMKIFSPLKENLLKYTWFTGLIPQKLTFKLTIWKRYMTKKIKQIQVGEH